MVFDDGEWKASGWLAGCVWRDVRCGSTECGRRAGSEGCSVCRWCAERRVNVGRGWCGRSGCWFLCRGVQVRSEPELELCARLN